MYFNNEYNFLNNECKNFMSFTYIRPYFIQTALYLNFHFLLKIVFKY